MESKKPIVSRPYTEDQIEAHAGKVGGRRNLREITISTDGGAYEFCYLVKKPSRAVMEAIADAEAKGGITDKGQPVKKVKDIGKIQKLMLGCVLEGDKEAYEYDGSIYTRLIKHVGELVTEARGELKKL